MFFFSSQNTLEEKKEGEKIVKKKTFFFSVFTFYLYFSFLINRNDQKGKKKGNYIDDNLYLFIQLK